MESIKQYIIAEIEGYLREKKIKFKRRAPLRELETATNAADDEKVAQLRMQKADKEKQAAGVESEIAKIKSQIDAIEKK